MLPTARSTPPDAAEASELALRFATQKRELELATQRVRELSIERDRLRGELAEEKAFAARARADAARHEEQAQVAATATRRVQELERRLQDQRELEARVDELEAQALEVVALRSQNSELEAKLAAALASPVRSEPGAGLAPEAGAKGADDLRRIRGIGPKFAEALRANGVGSFAEIAGWQSADIERVARLLKVKSERIAREDWVGKARALLADQETS